MPANAFAMLHLVGTTPHDLAGGTGNPPVYRSAFRANEKATQYVLGVVLGDLSLVAVLVNVASFSFFSLYLEVIIKSNDSVEVFRVAEYGVQY